MFDGDQAWALENKSFSLWWQSHVNQWLFLCFNVALQGLTLIPTEFTSARDPAVRPLCPLIGAMQLPCLLGPGITDGSGWEGGNGRRAQSCSLGTTELSISIQHTQTKLRARADQQEQPEVPRLALPHPWVCSLDSEAAYGQMNWRPRSKKPQRPYQRLLRFWADVHHNTNPLHLFSGTYESSTPPFISFLPPPLRVRAELQCHSLRM